MGGNVTENFYAIVCIQQNGGSRLLSKLVRMPKCLSIINRIYAEMLKAVCYPKNEDSKMPI